MQNNPVKPRGRNGGRKKEYNENTDTISFRVPISLIPKITEFVRNVCDKAKISKSV